MAYNLMRQGPLSVLIDAEFLQFYHSGVWNPPGCGGADLDHGELERLQPLAPNFS